MSKHAAKTVERSSLGRGWARRCERAKNVSGHPPRIDKVPPRDRSGPDHPRRHRSDRGLLDGLTLPLTTVIPRDLPNAALPRHGRTIIRRVLKKIRRKPVMSASWMRLLIRNCAEISNSTLYCVCVFVPFGVSINLFAIMNLYNG